MLLIIPINLIPLLSFMLHQLIYSIYKTLALVKLFIFIVYTHESSTHESTQLSSYPMTVINYCIGLLLCNKISLISTSNSVIFVYCLCIYLFTEQSYFI